MAKMTVEDLPLEGKKVLMRVDFNVPIKDGVVGDDNRIVAALPTINYVIDHGGRAILFSHLGRIKKEEDKPGLSLRPVAERLSNLLNKPVTFVPVTEGKQLEDAISQMNNGDVLLVQNTRYEDVKDGEYVKRESGNDPELGKYWASLGDVFCKRRLWYCTPCPCFQRWYCPSNRRWQVRRWLLDGKRNQVLG